MLEVNSQQACRDSGTRKRRVIFACIPHSFPKCIKVHQKLTNKAPFPFAVMRVFGIAPQFPLLAVALHELMMLTAECSEPVCATCHSLILVLKPMERRPTPETPAGSQDT